MSATYSASGSLSSHIIFCSEFVKLALERHPDLLPTLTAEGYLTRPREPGSLQAALSTEIEACADEAAVMRTLRRWRRRELVRIAWRDLAGESDVEESLRDLTALADVAVGCAVDFAYRALAQRYGTPRSADGDAQPLVTLGMGKLGGGELNFSSDIDLIFLFPEGGETDGRRSTSNEEFFTRLGRDVIRLLDAPTEEGFVFRVDMRLRPFGDSGPLAVSFSFLENYLQQHGRDWERYAYVKARALTGAAAFDALYRETLRPFVYRRYLDFGVFESLREMKGLIAREVERREMGENIKLGPGGIREIEFIVQSFQLLRGGQDKRLQAQSLLRVLPLLTGQKLLPEAAVAELRSAYLYLRRLENRLQMLGDEQTHTLPDNEKVRARLVAAMQYPDWSSLVAELDRHRAAVTRHFQSLLLGVSQADDGGPVRPQVPPLDLEALWDIKRQLPALKEALTVQGFVDAEPLAQLLARWRESQFVQRLDDIGRRRLQALMPRVLQELRQVTSLSRELRQEKGSSEDTLEIGRGPDAGVTLRRILSILESLGRRSAYLALLNENPAALRRLVGICARSDFLTRQIAAFPLLLDELIDRRVLEELPTKAEFAAEMALKREQTPDADPERQVEVLREFQRAAIFRVALADLTGRLPLMQVSDRLTDIAELILEEAMRLAWEQLTQIHGAPMCGDGKTSRPASIAAVAYGKMGAIELGYASDLDLVFLHDSEGEEQRTRPTDRRQKSIDNSVFFLRLGQRIVHLLTVHSAAGRLYEVDMRLRPSGKGGLMVTPVAAFERYQKTEAWTWEHQSLLRARAVAGAPHIRRAFEDIRCDVLCHHVRRESLREEVRKMRERMRAELSKAKPGQFDVKQDAGGIADIEFLAQYWALNWAQAYPPLVMFSDTIRQLESVASADLVPQATIDVLTGIYRDYRREIHHRSLERGDAVVAAERFAQERAQVIEIWNGAMSP